MIHETLAKIQKELKAPKGQYNSFGKYNYRSCEDILEAVKPLLGECILTISDKVVLIGDRYYIEATATLANSNNDFIKNTAYAREEAEKKGMDGSQITGTASSYARKYALNGLFCIDDMKDADAGGKGKQKATKAETDKKTAVSNRDKVIKLAQEKGITFDELKKEYGLNKDTTEERFGMVLKQLEGVE